MHKPLKKWGNQPLNKQSSRRLTCDRASHHLLIQQKSFRTKTIAAELKRALNSVMQSAQDQVLSALRFSKVVISKDLSHATVFFVAQYLTPEEIKFLKKKLDYALPFFKLNLSKRLLLRQIPKMHFRPDLFGIEIEGYAQFLKEQNQFYEKGCTDTVV